MIDLLKAVVETLFRLFRFPTHTGLRIIGTPGPSSPVFATCNFDLTVRRVVKALSGIDCYLLVCPTKGINVWCGATGGVFNAHSVISMLKTSNINERVEHRRLVLPQLSAAGIDVKRVKLQTGWRCLFGPTYAKDIPAYLNKGFKKTPEMSRVRFPLRDRLEMAAMWAGTVTLPVALVLAILAPHALVPALGLIWGLTLLYFSFFEAILSHAPGPVGLMKTLLLGFVIAAAFGFYSLAVGQWSPLKTAIWCAAILVVSVGIGFDFEGQSPLHTSSTVSYFAERWPTYLKLWARLGFPMEPPFTVHVNEETCTGCGTCTEVCPKRVFSLEKKNGQEKAVVLNPSACVLCTACIKQCPEHAIWSDPPLSASHLAAFA